eukprot:1088676-Pyramimonas_sp.AAC.2
MVLAVEIANDWNRDTSIRKSDSSGKSSHGIGSGCSGRSSRSSSSSSSSSSSRSRRSGGNRSVTRMK